VGHGARSAVELVEILKQAGIGTLVDVRAYPVSRRHPQFSREPLAAALAADGIAYVWQGKVLGGMRKGGYAAHMETADFQEAAAALTRLPGRACGMCAESDPEQCHRLHIADWLVTQGHRVIHLLGNQTQREHAQQRLF
jgi:uncharacterized protein (DUF488 family)